jgi:broad specificity phosphatase PhoE
MARTTIHLVRHGEVDNPDHLHYERLPGFHLSERGQLMAQRLAEHFMKIGQIDRLIASPLDRAQETAQPIAQALGLRILNDARLLEAGSHFAGLVITAQTLIKPSRLKLLLNPLRPSWGEPFARIAARMHRAVAQARQEVPDGQVVMVSHQSPIWRCRLRAEGRPLWPMPRGRACSLASVTSLVYEDGQLCAVGYCEPAADLLPPHLR